MNDRISALRQYLEENNIDGVILSSCQNVYYMSGFMSGESVYSDARLFITAKNQYILTDSRYTTYVKSACPEFELIECRHATDATVMAELIKKHSVKNVGVENQRILFSDFHSYFMKLGAELVMLNDMLEQMRITKSIDEICSIRKACEISCEALKMTMPQIKAGVSEISIAAALEYNMRLLGSERTAFDTIVVSGVKSAMPHGIPDGKLLAVGEPVTIDFGAVFNGYCADMTRTFFIGTPCGELAKIYDIVLQAQQKAIASFKNEMTCKEFDAIARDHIKDCGYGQYFGHSLGHGVGIEIHEAPTVSSRSDVKLSNGMVFSVEPGIYVENLGGVRIEDLVHNKGGKLEIFTGSIPKELTVL